MMNKNHKIMDKKMDKLRIFAKHEQSETDPKRFNEKV